VRNVLPNFLRILAVSFVFRPSIGLILAAGYLRAATAPGEDVYKSHCAACHDQPGTTREPSRAALQKMPAAHIL
jgi:hypothetical protein